LNYAIDRDGIVKAVTNGQATPLYGPITPATMGYWPGVEYVGYHYDPEKAKALLAEAGYTPGADGIMTKDGKPLALTLLYNGQSRLPEILQQQLKGIGIDVKLQQLEYGVLFQTLSGGDFDLGIDQLGWPNAGVLFVMFHSSAIGGWNRSRVTSLDPMVGGMVVATTPEGFDKATSDLQRKIVDEALVAPIYAPVEFDAVNKRIQGPLSSPVNRWLYLWDAYIDTAPQQ
jgi:peptide/nickel transport system substrate-binding protein